MKCPNCQSEVKDGMRFCPNCGNEVPQKRICPSCGSEITEANMRFCKNCGSPLYIEKRVSYSTSKNTDIKCPICNTSLSIGDQQCLHCQKVLYFQCNSCNMNFTYGELIVNKGYCPHCKIRIPYLNDVPDDKYPFYDKEIDDAIIEQGKAKLKKILSYAAFFLLCCLGGYFYINSSSSSNYNYSDTKTTNENSNILGTCKYCGSTITVNSPHEASNVCSKPSCKKQYEHNMYKSMYDHVNGEGSYDRGVNRMQDKFSRP